MQVLKSIRKNPWIPAVILLSIAPVTDAQISFSRLAPVIAEIIGINADVTSDVDKLLSGLNAVTDAYLGRPVQPPGATAEDFVELTKQRTKRINELELPPFEAPMPSNGNVPSNSFDAMRGELRSRNRTLMAAVIELAQGRSLRDQLSEGVRRVQQARKAAKTLGDLLQKVAAFDVSRTIEFTWLELTTTVDAALSDQESAVQAKRDQWLSMLKQRGNALEAARLDLRNALLVENAALQGQATVSRAEKDALAVRKTAIDQEQGIVDGLSTQIRQMRAEQARVIADRDAERRTRSSLQSSLGSLESEQRLVQDELAKPYDLCPNKNTYAECTHTNLKKQWDRRVADLNQRLTNVQQAIARYKRELSDVDQRISTLNGKIAAQQARIDQAVATYQTRDAALQKTRAKWQTDFDDFLAREHRSRVLLYADENARDQQQLGSIETRIREVLQ